MAQNEPEIGIHIPKSLNARAKRYQALVLLKENRQITIKEAIAELIERGANDAMPNDAPPKKPNSK